MSPLAIVGLACDYQPSASSIGPGLDAFARTLYRGTFQGTDVRVTATLETLVADLLADVVAPACTGIIVCADGAAAMMALPLTTASPGDTSAPTASLEAGDLDSALHMAQQWLGDGDVSGVVDLVVIAAEDSQGIGVVLLAREDRVRSGTIYARLEHVFKGADARMENPGDVGYMEMGMWPPAPEVVAGCAMSAPDLTCAVGSLAAAWGKVSPMAALIKVVLGIHRRTLYPSPEPEGAGALEGCEATPFYFVARARPWFTSDSQIRQAAIVYRRSDGWVQLRLAEASSDRQDVLLRGPLYTSGGCYLLPVAGSGRDAILSRLSALRQELEQGEDLAAIARRAAGVYAAEPTATHALALVGHSRDEMLKEMAHAVDGVDKAFEAGSRRKDWQTPKGSAFTAEPLGGDGVAFVYPGAFNAYVGMVQDLFQHFPGLHASFAHLTSGLGERLAERRLYPRRRVWGQADDALQWEARLRSDALALIESGAMAAVAHTLLLRQLFGVQPQMALGYSLGEISMLWAGGVWQEGDKGSAIFSSSSLFENRVVGPKLAIREHWGLAPDEPMVWASYLLKTGVEAVREVVASEPRVYLTLINLSDEVVIGGEAEACRRVVAALKCHALEVPYDVAIHNDAIGSEYENLATLYRHQIYNRPNTRFYSAAAYEPLVLEEDSLAEAMATMSCHPVDFPRLVRRVYEDGARVFVELGPLATCTRRIKRILKGDPHTAVAMNPGPGGDLEGVLGVLALLVAHRVPVLLDALYESEEAFMASEELVLWPECVLQDVPEGAVQKVQPAMTSPLLEPRVEDARVHRAFLEARDTAQRGAGSVIGLQVAASGQLLGTSPGMKMRHGPGRDVAFTEADLHTFATGDVAQCFGADYEIYRGRRVSRIPNGELQFMSRIMELEGTPHIFVGEPALWSEFDVPARGWFDPGGVGLPPHVALMEMALQPCGFLSAYLRSSMLLPEADLYFRNLGGHAQILAEPDLRGKTVANHIRLISSTRAQGVILQNFTFSMSCEGTRFYEGDASFGFFPREAMLRQSGAGAPANGGEAPRSRIAPPHQGTVPLSEPVPHQLQLLHRIDAEPESGRYGKGYVVGEGHVTPWDWFFRAHFHEDPVMPGSLGVEAAAQALRAFGRWRYPAFVSAIAAPAAGAVDAPVQEWKYRGQIAPPEPGAKDRGAWSVEVHVSQLRADAGRSLVLTGDAEVWRGSGAHHRVRIYEISGLSVRLDLGEEG
jgi:PfaB family protein